MYDVSRKDVVFTEIDGTCRGITFNSPFESGFPSVDKARLHLYPVDKADSAVIFVPGLGDRSLKHFRIYIEGFRKQGFTVALPILPYFYHRKVKEKPETSTFLKGTSEDLQKKYEQAVTDVRCCIDYLEGTGIHAINIMGMSFGGMIATIAMAVDRRIQKGVLIVTGGNYLYITWESIATKVFRIKYEEDDSCNPERCREIHKDFDSAAMECKDPEKLSRYPSCFTYDPSFFAHCINPNRVVMFTAPTDPFIPRLASDDLWERLGKPKRFFLPAGHMTSHVFFKRRILKESTRFLTS